MKIFALIKPRHFLITVILLFFGSGLTSAQEGKYQIGKPYLEVQRTQGALFDYSKQDAINMDVFVWGYVKYPGKYTVPQETSTFELISLAGGPVEDAIVEEIRLYRKNGGEKDELYTFSYDDVMWQGEILTDKNKIPELKAGDAIMIPGKERYFLRDYLTMGVSIFSALISLSILILNISE